MTRREAPLYDPGMINEDLRCRGLSMLARLLFAQLAALANAGGGYLKIGTAPVDIARAAAAVAFEGDVQALSGELVAMGLLVEDDEGWHVPEIKAAALLRDKRRRAGGKGGEATTAKRSDVCLSNVISLAESKAKREAAKKEKRTKKEKNIKYIYILGTKVETDDRGSADNPKFFDGRVIQLWKRDWKALEGVFGLNDAALDELMRQQDDWLSESASAIQRANWFGVTLAWLKGKNGGVAA